MHHSHPVIRKLPLMKQATFASLNFDAKKRRTRREVVEHPFRVLKCQFGYRKVRYKGLARTPHIIITLFALTNLWMARRRLLATTGEVRP